MPHDSLLTGRNAAPLTEREIFRATNTFFSLDRDAPVRYEPGARTRFRVEQTADGELAEIVFGPDLYPGQNIIDPNSSLDITAAAAHELVHYYRWENKTELDGESLIEIDEALTSLGAIVHFQEHLGGQQIRQLVSDAIQRLQRFVNSQNAQPSVAANGQQA